MDKSVIQPIHPQLRFGVELSKLYPAWYLHPGLKNLIYETKINTERRKEFTLDEILEQEDNQGYQGNLDESLYLKDRLISGKNILGLNASPGVHIWLLRHFLGLLPTPVFPKDNIRPNSWVNISIQCKDSLILMKIKTASNNHLQEIIASEFVQLPPRNLTLILELFELFRCLGTKLFIKSEIDKRSAMAIVRYFTPCLFTRPYRPGFLTSTDKRLFALVLFIIFHWPAIKAKCQGILSTNVSDSITSRLYCFASNEDEDITENVSRDTTDRDIISELKNCFTEDNQKENSYDDGPVYLVDNFTQTSQQNVYFDSENDNFRASTPYHTAEVHEEMSPVSSKNGSKVSNSTYTKLSKIDEDYEDNNLEQEVPNVTNKNECIFSVSLPFVREDSKLFGSKPPSESEIKNAESNNEFYNCESKVSSKSHNDVKNSEVKNSFADMEDLIGGVVSPKVVKEKPLDTSITEVSSPRRCKVDKIVSSKVLKLRRNYKKESQVIVLHINPCTCAKKEKKKSKARINKSMHEAVGEDVVDYSFYEEKNNFESPEKIPTQNKKVHNETLLDIPNFCCNYTKNINSAFGNTRAPYGWSLNGNSAENEGYIFDSFIGSLHKEEETPFDVSNLAPSNPFNDKIDSPRTIELKERMARIGWTYADTSGSNSPRLKSGADTPNVKSEHEFQSPYQLCYDPDSKSMYFDVQSKTMSAKEEKKESSFMSNLKKIGSKLNIFKNMSPKFTNKSSSAEALISDIKYEDLTKRSHSI